MILFSTLLSRDKVPGGLPERDFLLPAALLAGLCMIGTRCCTSGEAMQSIDWSVLIVIGAALGIGEAMKMSGLSTTLATGMIGMAGTDAWVTLGMVYFLTMILTELITNNAAASLMFPLALAAAESLESGLNPL